MKRFFQNHTNKQLFGLCLLILSILIAGSGLLISLLNKPQSPPANNTSSNNTDKPSNNGNNVKPPVDEPTTPANPPANPPSNPPTNPPISSDSVCSGNQIKQTSFNLSQSAYVYNTAANALSKTNPAATYPAGDYFVYKCANNIVNITKTKSAPGGWIDPANPYSNSKLPQPPTPPTPPVTPAVDVMKLDNTSINWSHEYPTSFVRDYNGFWNVTPGQLYLTFDCGYDLNGLAGTIMDTLKTKQVKAVFFVTGDYLNSRPDLIRRMVNEGHVVGNHSFAHLNQPANLTDSTTKVIDDIKAWENSYRSITGSLPKIAYFRPPAGTISRRSIALMQQLGYKSLLWGAAYRDWDPNAQPTPTAALSLLRQYISSGDIILLHGVSQTSSDILTQLIDEYRQAGYSFALP